MAEFKADVSFELTSESRTWAVFDVKDMKRGFLGTFRIQKETLFCTERDDDGTLLLGDYFSGLSSTEDFMDRHELLNWLYEIFASFCEEGKYPPYHFVST